MSASTSASFRSPPLDETVLGVQFTSPEDYNTTVNGDVWALFKEEFPVVEEQPALPPQTEVFGGAQFTPMQINLGEIPAKTRLWFISRDESHLFQHQADRLLLNWRSRKQGAPYPRHERMLGIFRDRLTEVSDLNRTRFGADMEITQAEVTYINVIPVTEAKEIGRWFAFINSGAIELEGVGANFGQVVKKEDGTPIARMYYELQTVLLHGSERNLAFRFSLTCRGRPEDGTIAGALKFLTFGRNRIVEDFCRLTTKEAHERWGREA